MLAAGPCAVDNLPPSLSLPLLPLPRKDQPPPPIPLPSLFSTIPSTTQGRVYPDRFTLDRIPKHRDHYHFLYRQEGGEIEGRQAEQTSLSIQGGGTGMSPLTENRPLPSISLSISSSPPPPPQSTLAPPPIVEGESVSHLRQPLRDRHERDRNRDCVDQRRADGERERDKDNERIPEGRFARLMDSFGRQTNQSPQQQQQQQHFTSHRGRGGLNDLVTTSGSDRAYQSTSTSTSVRMDQGYSHPHSHPGHNGYNNGNGVNPSNLSTTGYGAQGHNAGNGTGSFLPGTNPSWPGTGSSTGVGGSSHTGRDYQNQGQNQGNGSVGSRGSVYGDYSPSHNNVGAGGATGEMGSSYGSMNSGGLRNPGGHFGGGVGGGAGPSFGFDVQHHQHQHQSQQQHQPPQTFRRKFGNGSGMEDDEMHSHQYYGGGGGGNASSTNGNASGNGGRKRKVSIRDEDEDDEDDDDDNDHDHDDGGSGTGGGNNGSSQSRGKRALRGISSGAGGGGGGNGGGTGDKDDETRKKGKERPGRGKGMRRGARACTNCRRGKNRCEGDHPCNRCAAQNLECVFAKPPPKVGNSNSNSLQQQLNGNGNGSQIQQNQSGQLRMNGMGMSMGIGMGIGGMGTGMQGGWNSAGDPEGRFMHIESSVNHLAASQNQMQSTLSQILSALSQNQMNNQHVPQLNYPQHSPSQNDGMGTSQTSLSMQHHASRNMSGADMFSMNNLAPPEAQDSTRLDPFSPGTVAALTEVAVANGYTGSSVGLVQDGTGMDVTYSPSVGTSAGGLKHGNEMDGSHAAPRSGSVNGNRARRDEDGFAWPDPPVPKAPIAKMEEDNMEEDVKPKEFPKLPGFKPPPHRYANYGLVVSSTAASSDDESEDTLPRSSLNAPIEALHQLANAADQAAKENAKLEAENRQQGFLSPPRVLQNQLKFKRMKKPDPAPRNAFPDVITKGLVSPEEARELWDIFFSGCHYFIPVFDPSYDEFESFVQRTPFSFDGMLAVAAKIRAGAGPLGRTHTRCLEEAQGIARSTLFGPVVRKEAVMAVLILASWSQDPWLPSGHALRMGLDMNLHKALEKLGEDVGTFGGGKARTEAEERDLVVSARIWLNCYLNDHTVSLGTGRPLMLRDDESVRNARQLLTHPMASETDVRLVACVELMSHKVRVWTHLHPLRGRIDTTTIDFVRRVSNDLLAWHAEWRTRHLQKHEEESVLVKLLDAELYYAQLWTACVALRGCNWDKLNLDQRELAFGAKDAALKCLSAYKSSSLRHYLKYAVHETMVQASFAAVFLLKIAILFPTQVTAKFISTEVADLANLMSECAAERYALTLRLMLRSFRRKMGETTMAPGTPRTMANGQVAGPSVDGMIPGHRGLESLLSMDGDSAVDFSILDDLGPFNWPEDGFSPSNLPQWITEGNVMDLGLPYDGSDSIFLPPELANMFLPAPTSWQLGDSAETGAEAW